MKLRENKFFPQTSDSYYRLFALYMNLGLDLRAKYDPEMEEIVILGSKFKKYSCKLYFENGIEEEEERITIFDCSGENDVKAGISTCYTDYFCMFNFATMKFVLADVAWTKKYMKGKDLKTTYDDSRKERYVTINPLKDYFPDNPIVEGGRTMYYRGFLDRSHLSM